MAKATELYADIMTAAVPVPRAAQTSAPATAPRRTKQAPKVMVVPLQVRWPASDVKAAKLAAIQGDFPTVSDFMLACFHAYMKTRKQPRRHRGISGAMRWLAGSLRRRRLCLRMQPRLDCLSPTDLFFLANFMVRLGC